MISITGSPVALTTSPRQRTPLCNIRTLLTTRLALPIFTPMALGLPVVVTDMAGGLSAQASAGHLSPWVNGFGIQVLAGLLPATNPGVGLLIIMAAGSLTLLVAGGFIHRQLITEGIHKSAFLPLSTRLTHFIGPRPLFSFAKTASSASCP